MAEWEWDSLLIECNRGNQYIHDLQNSKKNNKAMNKAQFKHLITALRNSVAGMSIAVMPTLLVTTDTLPITLKEYFWMEKQMEWIGGKLGCWTLSSCSLDVLTSDNLLTWVEWTWWAWCQIPGASFYGHRGLPPPCVDSCVVCTTKQRCGTVELIGDERII